MNPESQQSSNHASLAPGIKTIAVLGAGTMGHGIAQVCAAAGFQVVLRDVNETVLARASEAIKRNLDKGIKLGKVSTQERAAVLACIAFTSDFDQTRDADLFVEAAPERLELKREILRDVERVATKDDYIFATNTSSLSITEIARGARRPAQIVGMHFFNPVHVMRLLEIVVGTETSERTLAVAHSVAERIGKRSITVRDTPGFASSRLGVALGLEAMRMVEQGVATPADIDTAMELGYNHPVGPLRLTDIVGLDVRLSIAQYLHRTLDSEVFRAPQLLEQMVRDGKLGRKTGEGFYKWNNGE